VPFFPRRLRLAPLLPLLFLLTACGPAADDVIAPPSAPPASVASAPPPDAASARPMTQTPTPDDAFAAFANRFLAQYLELSPVEATQAGEHRYDGRWPDLSVEGEATTRKWLAAQLAALEAMPEAALNEQNRTDRAIVENQVRAAIFAIDELRGAENDPMTYTSVLGDGLDPLVTREFATIEQRMQSLLGRLGGIPAVVAVAKKRLKSPPKLMTETAIKQNHGLVDLCDHELAEAFAKAPAQRAALEAAAKQATAALEDFQAFLEGDLLPRSTGDVRIGRARFEKKLRFSLGDDIDIDALAKGARDLLAKTQDEMVDTAKEIWPTVAKGKKMPPSGTTDERKALVRAVLAKLAEDRPTDATIVTEASKLLADATAFVRDKNLVRVPDEPCKVIEMPEYRRGVAIAYCDSSGPLEEKQETFYAIAPTPKDWKPKRVESFYREYNRSMLADLTIHEAMPGHYLQAMHNNRFPSKLRAVFSSGPFVEGWAVYTEWLMARSGFGGPKVRLERQKMTLRLAANAILDHEIHAGTMDEKAALDLMTREAFQEEGEAVGKWRRAQLTSAQLTTYYYGFTEMMRLRAAFEASPRFQAAGKGFDERAYHDALLSFGSPPMRLLRKLMGAQ
jgi:uncharacterized protein (DUF885 family)